LVKFGVFLGEYVIPEGVEWYEIRNPADVREIISEFPQLNRNHVREAINNAKEAFRKWSTTTPQERARILYEASKIVENKSRELAILLTREEGKTINESLFEVNRTVNLLRFYAGLIVKEKGKVIPSQDRDTFIITLREPIGVIGVITPWNFPLSLPAWKIIPALATGNTVVWKPASITPTIALEFAKILYAAGLPKGALNLVTGKASIVGEEIIENSNIEAITFTGSTETGRYISKKIGSQNRFVRLQLELGGKNALVLTKNGDIELAIELATRSAFGLTGQACTATSRFLVPEDLYDKILPKLIERTKRIVVGNGLDERTEMGPLASKEQFDKVLNYIRIGEEEGAKLVFGGKVLREGNLAYGYFIEPTIFTEVTADMRIAKEEIFGPILSVMKYRNLNEAIEIVNSVEYGLVAGIVSKDINEVMKFVQEAKVGVVKINKPTVGLEPWVPYGGFKASGNDNFKEMGEEALEFFTRLKSVYIGY
jgi:aldehyde dehydrogenase (NAD+)